MRGSTYGLKVCQVWTPWGRDRGRVGVKGINGGNSARGWPARIVVPLFENPFGNAISGVQPGQKPGALDLPSEPPPGQAFEPDAGEFLPFATVSAPLAAWPGVFDV